MQFSAVRLGVPADAPETVFLRASVAHFWGLVTSPAPFSAPGRGGEAPHTVEPPPYDAEIVPEGETYLPGEVVRLEGRVTDPTGGSVAGRQVLVRVLDRQLGDLVV